MYLARQHLRAMLILTYCTLCGRKRRRRGGWTDGWGGGPGRRMKREPRTKKNKTNKKTHRNNMNEYNKQNAMDNNIKSLVGVTPEQRGLGPSLPHTDAVLSGSPAAH